MEGAYTVAQCPGPMPTLIRAWEVCAVPRGPSSYWTPMSNDEKRKEWDWSFTAVQYRALRTANNL